MLNRDAMFSSSSDLWETPKDLFDALNNEFHFDLDACAVPENTKCIRFYSPADNSLLKQWDGRVWCNPPYGRVIKKWVMKAVSETKNAEIIVMLLPARTDTEWFHKYLWEKKNVEIRFLRGRLKFGGAVYNAPFPSMVVILKGEKNEG